MNSSVTLATSELWIFIGTITAVLNPIAHVVVRYREAIATGEQPGYRVQIFRTS